VYPFAPSINTTKIRMSFLFFPSSIIITTQTTTAPSILHHKIEFETVRSYYNIPQDCFLAIDHFFLFTKLLKHIMRFTFGSAIVVATILLAVGDAFVPVARTKKTLFTSKESTSTLSSSPLSSFALFAGRTLYDKIWDDHVVVDDGMSTLLYVDRHLVHEVTSPQAFEGLRLANRGVRRPDCTLVTVDHNVPTEDRSQLIDVQTFIEETASRTQVMQLDTNVADFGLKYFGMADERQGIVHIIGPEQGFTLPGCVTVCGDSHTATHGAFGALAFGIGTSEVEHVLATQVHMMVHYLFLEQLRFE
jgi:hypothetical protein